MPELKRVLRRLSKSTVSAAVGGGFAAMLLQSSTAVALIGTGFAVSGMLSTPSALALLLGADLGSALLTQILILPVSEVIALLLIIGVAIFSNAKSRKTKQVGRILVGFALVLIALGMIREATAPIGENGIVQSIAAYFEADLISAYVIGAALTWAMHSSIAAVLTFATFAATGLIAGPVAAALVIGANLGAAAIPIGLLWSRDRPAKLVLLGNLLARGATTLVFLALLMRGVVDLAYLGPGPAQQAISLHILLNATMLVIALPFVGWLIDLAARALPKHATTSPRAVSALDADALDHPPLALACAQRELLRMAETVQSILVPAIGLFRAWDADVARMIELREEDVDRMHFETKIYVSRLRETELSPADEKRTLDIVALANNLEEASDRIAVNLLALARKMQDQGVTFSPEGLSDLEDFHDQVVTNGQLALSVLTTGDAEAARQLVAEKDRIRVEEQRFQELHLKRLQEGGSASIETTNMHQESLRLIKQINAALTYVAYPIAEETGDLLGSRLARPATSGSPA